MVKLQIFSWDFNIKTYFIIFTGLPREEYCDGGSNYTKDSSDCSIYYECRNLSSVFYCSAGQAFDVSVQTCKLASQVAGCENLLPSLDGVDFSACNNETCLVPGDCGFFYNCETKIRQPCPHGLVFRLLHGSCQLPEKVPGCEGYIPSPTPVPVIEKNCYQPKKP